VKKTNPGPPSKPPREASSTCQQETIDEEMVVFLGVRELLDNFKPRFAF
jgi:hypothetical protein